MQLWHFQCLRIKAHTKFAFILQPLKSDVTYIVGGPWHPNQNIAEFTSALDLRLSEISSQKIKCIIAGDFNIDLTKCTVSSDTST